MHEAVAIGACAMSDLACMTGVATCCGKCAGCAGNVLNEALGATYTLPALRKIRLQLLCESTYLFGLYEFFMNSRLDHIFTPMPGAIDVF